MLLDVPDRTPFAALAASMPGLAGPSMLGTIAFRNAMQLGYGVNVLLDDHSTMSVVAGPLFGAWWAVYVVATAAFALLGTYLTQSRHRIEVELWSSIGVFSALVTQVVVVIVAVVGGVAPNGLLPMWWPAAIAAQVLWRIRSSVRDIAAQEGQRRREAGS